MNKLSSKDKLGHNNAFVFLSIVLLFMVLVCGCGSNASTQIMSDSAIEQYAKDTYGDCTFVKSEHYEDKNRCYFTDDEYGFEYFVANQKTGLFGLDNRLIIATDTKIITDYEIAYYECYLANLMTTYGGECEEILTDNGLTIRYPDIASAMNIYDMGLAWIEGVTEDNADVAREWANDYLEHFFEVENRDVFPMAHIELLGENPENPGTTRREVVELTNK